VAVVAVAGCGSSNKNSGGSASTQSSTPSTSSSSSSSSGGGGISIKMQNIQFSPNAQTVKVGEKVTWTNEDSVDHNVTAKSGGTFKSSNFGQGATFSFTPTKAGTIKYTCTLHPGMDGTLTVTG
jgi:plastocyanin